FKTSFVQTLTQYDVEVKIHTHVIHISTFTGKFNKVIYNKKPNEKNWIKETKRFNDKKEAIDFIIEFDNKTKKISPIDLPDKLIASAKAVIDFYDSIGMEG